MKNEIPEIFLVHRNWNAGELERVEYSRYCEGEFTKPRVANYCLCVCVNIHTYRHTYEIYKHIFIYVDTHINTSTCIKTHTCAWAHTHTN